MNRGAVWEAILEPTLGAEITKIRPCVIINRDALARLPMKIIVPLTEWNPAFASAPWHVPIEGAPSNGLTKKSSADTFQVLSISEQRLIRCLGTLPEDTMEAIGKGLRLSLALD